MGHHSMAALRRPVSRRRLLACAAGAAGLGGAFLLACGGDSAKDQARDQAPSAQPGAGGSAAQATQGTPVAGGAYNAFLLANALLDPHKGSASAQQVSAGVYSRLFRFKTGADPNVIADHDLENDLAAGIESPDALTWTVKLRPDAVFQNVAPVSGHPVEAEDVKATFLRALNPALNNPNRGSMGMIDLNGIQTPDKQTVVFKLNYAYAPFAKALASPAYSLIMPREVLTDGFDPAKTAIGSGPFMLESFTPDVAYVYKKNPQWFEKGRPYIDTLRVAVVPDAAQQFAQFTAGNADEYTPDVAEVDAVVKQNPKATLFTAPDGRPFPVYLQLGDPASPFQDVRLRRALSMALDREAIGRAIYLGKHQIVPFIPAYMGKWALRVDELEPSIRQYFTYNPAEAKKLLEAAGATNLQLKFVYISNGPFTTPTYVKQAETVANMFNQAGIKTTIITHDYNKDYIAGGKGSRQGNFDKDTVIFSGIASYTEVDEHLFVNFHSKSTSNGEKLNDPALDAMIDKQRTIVDENERLKAAKEIQKYIAGQVYAISTAGAYLYLLTQPRVQGYHYSNSLGKHTETHSKLWLKQQ